MNNGERPEGGVAARGADEWAVVALVPVVGVLLLVVLACWLWYSCAAARRTATKGGPHTRQRQRLLSAADERKLVEAEAASVGGPGASVVDLGDAMVRQPPSAPVREPRYENLVSHTGYENLRNFPPWVHLVLSRVQHRLQGRQPQVRHLPVPGTQPRSGWPTAGTQVFHAEPAATSTPLSSGDSSPGSEVLQRAPRESRHPPGLPSGTYHPPFRDGSQRESTRPHRDWEHGASRHPPPRVGNHYSSPTWGQTEDKASAEEPVYEQVQAVPTGKVTPIRRQLQPHMQPAAVPLAQPPHREGGKPASPPGPPYELLLAKPPEGEMADFRGKDSIQLRLLQVSKESGAVAQVVLQQRAQSCSTIRTRTSTSTNNNTVRRPPIPLPRTSVGTTQRRPQGPLGTAAEARLVVDVHSGANTRSLTHSPGSTLSARSRRE